VDEFLSEKEQLEQIREWWREYGWYLIGGVALGVLMLVGWNQYQGYEQRRVAEASALFDELAIAVRDQAVVRADELASELRTNYPSSAYTDQAGLLMASLKLDQQDADAALAELEHVIDSTSDTELGQIAELRRIRLLIHLSRYDAALAAIDAVEAGRFGGRLAELRGDIYLAQGDAEAARAAYLEAFNAEFTDVLDRNLLQMKIDDLPVATADAAPPTETAE